MDQFEQLLTCAICLDRYRNPKLLPCQHSFCMEPCMEGLVDYVRRQVKCPECRAEHRVGYQFNVEFKKTVRPMDLRFSGTGFPGPCGVIAGILRSIVQTVSKIQGVQAFPTNVTLQRFLELHIDLTGELPDPLSNQIMERCQICSEKSYCNLCAHCDKKVCPDCKEAHIDVLKREIQRIGNQVRRVLHRLNDALSAVEKNTMQLQSNSISVMDEIDDIYRRLSKALKDRTENLKNEVERYLGNELKQLSSLRTNLEQEVANIQSNIELVEKYMLAESGSSVTWQDNELMDTKDIFLKTMEFIRNFEYEPGDYGRRIKFNTNHDPNSLASTLSNFGELHLPTSNVQNLLGGGTSSNNSLAPGGPHMNQGQGSALMRSKSDHRLTMQFRGQPDEDECPSFGGGRKFGDQRPIRPYGQTDDDSCGGERKSRFRSRFTRHLDTSFDEPEAPPNRVRFDTQQQPPVKERERVLDTEDASKGPMSGVTRLADSSLVIQRIAEAERPPKPAPPPPVVQQQPVQPQLQPKVTTPAPVAPWRNRQLSEEDEISKQKKENKAQEKASSGGTAVRRQTSNEPRSPGYNTSTTTTTASDDHSTELPPQHETTGSGRVRKLSPDRFSQKKRAESEDSGSTSESASSSGSSPVGTGAIFSTEEVKNRFLNKAEGTSTPAGAPHRKDSTSSVASSTTGNSSTNRSRPYQNRYQTKPPEKPAEPAKEEDEEEEESSESESEEEESEEESDSPPPTPPKKTTVPEPKSRMEKTDIGPLLARSANARDSPVATSNNTTGSSTSSLYGARKRVEEPQSPTHTTPQPSALSSYRSRSRISSPTTRDPDPEPTTTRRYGSSSTSTGSSGLGSSRYPSSYSASDYTPSTGLSRSRTGTALYSPPADDTPSSRFSSGLASKYLNRSRHNFDVDDHPSPSSRYGSSTTTPTTSSAPMTRRSYLSKKRNGQDGDSTKSSRLSNIRDRRARINRSKSSHDVLAGIDFNRDEDDEEPESPKITYNKFQRRKSSAIGADPDFKTPSAEDSSSLSSWARYLKNKYGKDKQPTAQTLRSPVDEAPRFHFSTNPYKHKKRLQFKFGSRGSDPGFFTWPRGIASGPDGSIVVADSSNHRIQVFDQHGSFVKEFGQYGNGEGEFDCLAGVAVNRIGQFIISDRYNHRIQVFDPSGRFLRAFGSQGSSDGRFNYPWGVCTDALGFIYVCDKENHRIQVFQSDGTFVGKFGTMGSKIGELEHPHYIAVTSTNKVVVSDTNNHRIQIFDVNGKVLSSFGTEGTEDGQFKLPRGVAVNEEGYIFVGDSGNNRIQIFNPDGTFLHTFGAWGSGDGEFKGMEGVAVTPNGSILVCDRENHRIQAF